jgi:hypothetical protein
MTLVGTVFQEGAMSYRTNVTCGSRFLFVRRYRIPAELLFGGYVAVPSPHRRGAY